MIFCDVITCKQSKISSKPLLRQYISDILKETLNLNLQNNFVLFLVFEDKGTFGKMGIPFS